MEPKTVLIISDVVETKAQLKQALEKLDAVTLIGVERTPSVAIQKASLLEPNYLLVEQRSTRIDGVSLAAQLDGNAHPSSVILLHSDNEPQAQVYSDNILGYLPYSQISASNLQSLFAKRKHIPQLSKNAADTALPFDCFHLLIAVWDSLPPPYFPYQIQRLAKLLEQYTNHLEPYDDHICVAYVKQESHLPVERLLERMPAFFENQDRVHFFVFPNMVKGMLVHELIQSYRFPYNICDFFETEQQITIYDSPVMPKRPSDAEHLELLYRLEQALVEGDIQGFHEDCNALFAFVRQCLSQEVYQNTIAGINHCLNKVNHDLPIPLVFRPLSAEDSAEAAQKRTVEIADQLLNAAGKIYSSKINSAIYYIRKNCDQCPTLQMIADYVHVSPVYLSQKFHRETNQTVVGYFQQVRLRHAKHLLEAGWKIKDVSEACGFTDPKYFARQFRKLTGIIPSEYQQEKGIL